MRKNVFFLLLLLLLLLTLSGCGDSIAPETEKVSLTALQYELENQTLDFDNMWFFQQIEEQTGVHVDFDVVKHSDWTNRVNLMFASGRYHDLILRGSLDVEDYGVTQHVILPLDDYLEEYMPTYFSRLPIDNAGRTLPSSDGKMYYVGFLLSQGINTNGHFFINKTWLDKLELSVPTTTEDLTEVLRAFKNGDPNGNGLADEIPYEATFADVNTGLYNAFSAFGIPMNEYFVHLSADGKVLFMPEEDGFRACVEWLHSLCQEGLLDVESLTQGSNLWAAKVNQQKAGYFTYWRLKNTALSDDIAADYVVMLPVHAKGYEASLARTEDEIEFGAALTIQNHDIPSSLRWLDAQFETENMLVAQNGKIGDTLILRGDGRYEVTYVPAGNELYKTVPIICGQFFAPASYYASVYVPAAHRQEKSAYCALYDESGVLEDVPYTLLINIVPIICGQFFAPASYYASVYVPAAHRQEKSAYCALYDESGVLEDVPYTLLINIVPITSEESARIQQLYTSLKSAVNAYLVEFVTRGVTDERFADFLTELNSIGAQEYVSLYQTAYDRYMKGLSEQ